MCIDEAGNQLHGLSWKVKLTNLYVHNYFASHVYKIQNMQLKLAPPQVKGRSQAS